MSLYEGNITINLEDYNQLIRQAHEAEILKEVLWDSVSGRYGFEDDKKLIFDNAPINRILRIFDYDQYTYVSNMMEEKEEAEKAKAEAEAKAKSSVVMMDVGQPMN